MQLVDDNVRTHAHLNTPKVELPPGVPTASARPEDADGSGPFANKAVAVTWTVTVVSLLVLLLAAIGKQIATLVAG